jgi:hypothetical protein
MSLISFIGYVIIYCNSFRLFILKKIWRFSPSKIYSSDIPTCCELALQPVLLIMILKIVDNYTTLTKISYIWPLFNVRFIQDSSLFRVWLRHCLTGTGFSLWNMTWQFNLYILNTCLLWTQKLVPWGLGLDRFHCIINTNKNIPSEIKIA